MRIAVDGRHLAAGRGIARYTRSLLDVLALAHPEDDVVPVRGSRPVFAAAALTGRPRIERMAGGADVVWIPAPAPLAVGREVPRVLTVHDASWEAHPGDFTAYERLWHRAARVPELARRADLVIAVSKATATEVQQRWGVAPERIRVVLSGPGLEPPAHPSAANPAAPPYVLAVGALEPRKAPDVLAEAYGRARAQGLRARLVVAGTGRAGAALRRAGAEVHSGCDDGALSALYAGALAVVHPARLEGFGFPPVEGLAHGTPPVVADLPVYDETIGAGGLRVAPGDPAALAAALLRIEREPRLREELVRTGRAAIAALSWERAARETRAALAEAART